jgi:hypothetical protein
VLTAEGKKARTTARKQKWRADNPEKVRASIKKSYEKHKAKRLADNKAWHAANRDKANARMRKWREANQEKARAHVQKWQENNREKYLARMREWRANNAAYCVAFRRNKNIESPEKLAAARVKRRARKLGATPSWLTKDQLDGIRLVYQAAQGLTSGVLLPDQSPDIYVVDHIVPLQGRRVCGLHVPWNLQILTYTENAAKNCYLPDEEYLINYDAPGYKESEKLLGKKVA